MRNLCSECIITCNFELDGLASIAPCSIVNNTPSIHAMYSRIVPNISVPTNTIIGELLPEIMSARLFSVYPRSDCGYTTSSCSIRKYALYQNNLLKIYVYRILANMLHGAYYLLVIPNISRLRLALRACVVPLTSTAVWRRVPLS